MPGISLHKEGRKSVGKRLPTALFAWNFRKGQSAEEAELNRLAQDFDAVL